MNKIRKWFAAEVEQLLPVLHETYRAVGQYQKRRTEQCARELTEQLGRVAPLLGFFAEHVPGPKRGFFTAVGDAELPLSDRIIALDIAVGAMHIEFAVPRAYMHPVSERLRDALEAARLVEGEAGRPPVAEAGDDVLVRGIAASPGVAVGRAFLTRRNGDYRRVPKDAVVVANMTRPELVLGAQRPAAIVTDLGGSLCHAAVIAREMGIPCVVGTGNATEILRDRQWLRVDGTRGEVRPNQRPEM